MRKLSPYVKNRIAKIKAERRKKRPRVKRRKLVDVILKTKGFYMDIVLCPDDELDMLILKEANNLILRRAA